MQNGYKETGYMMKLNGVVQEIIITNGEFVKESFALSLHFIVLVLYIQKYGNKQKWI